MTEYGIRLPPAGSVHADVHAGSWLDQWCELAVAAERSGFSSVWVPDEATSAAAGGPEAYTALGALAVRTARVRLGALVSDVTSRSPGVLAKMVTTVDVLTHGRAVLGLGQGGPSDRAAPGEDAGDSDRSEMLDEAVRICRALFTSDDVSFTGRHFQLDHARNLPRPVQTGGPRIVVGPHHDPAVLAVAARWADGYAVTGSAQTAERAAEALQRQCDLVGRDPAEVAVIWVVPGEVTSTGDGAPAGRPKDLAGLVLGPQVAAVDEVVVVVTRPAIDPERIAWLGAALDLGGR